MPASKKKRGKRMTSGKGWKLHAPKGQEFPGTLIDTINWRGFRLALFSVPKGARI
jgi:hypothetical protein